MSGVLESLLHDHFGGKMTSARIVWDDRVHCLSARMPPRAECVALTHGWQLIAPWLTADLDGQAFFHERLGELDEHVLVAHSLGVRTATIGRHSSDLGLCRSEFSVELRLDGCLSRSYGVGHDGAMTLDSTELVHAGHILDRMMLHGTREIF